MGALDGIRILDLTWGIAGPLGVLLLAEQGADVVKVEPPGGDPFRSYDGARVWHRSRRSVVVDLKSDDGKARFEDLLAGADVLAESFRPGVMGRLGLGFDDVHARHPHLVYLSVPAYPEGHRHALRPGYDALVQASSGQQWEQPGWRPGPVFLAMPMPSMGACYLVTIGIAAALVARERTGRGQHVTTSLFQGALLYTTQIWQHIEKAPAAVHELMAKSYPPGIHQQFVFECANGGWIHTSVMSGLTPDKSLDEILGLPDAPDPFTFMALPPEEREAFTARRREAFKQHDCRALAAELQAHGHAAEPIVPPAEMFEHPQLVANDMVVTVDDPDLGPTTQLGVPLHLLGTPGAVQGPQPRVGAHTDEVLAEARRMPSGAASAPARAGPATRGAAGPLAGIRVVDFGQYLAGPFGPMVLADLGADVIKVEPLTGDAMRLATKPFFGCQRGKRSVALNIKDPDGLAVALDLVRSADIVHHNMTKGVATRLGIDDAACRAVNPNVIYCNTYAYGREGPLSHSGGLDPLYQASAGLEWEAGPVEEGNPPLYYRFGMADASNALLSVAGCLVALYHRERTGAGQELWTSLLDGGAVFSSDVFLHDGRPWDRPRLDRQQTGFGARYRLYPTQDGGWIQIAAVTDDEWARLLEVLGAGDDGALAERFLTKTAQSWHNVLDEAGVPNEVPLDPHQGELVLFDADNERLGLVVEYEHPLLGRLRQFGALMQFSATPVRIHRPPPLVGQHTDEVLGELGYGDARIDDLVARGVVARVTDDYEQRFVN